MISLTTIAVAAVKVALSQAAHAADGLRVVAGADAADTLKVMLHLDVVRADDRVIEQGGLKLLLDDRSCALAEDLQIDFVAAGAGGFVVAAGAARRGLNA